MSCQQCGAPCQGGLCRQCEIEAEFAHLKQDLAERDDGGADDA